MTLQTALQTAPQRDSVVTPNPLRNLVSRAGIEPATR